MCTGRKVVCRCVLAGPGAAGGWGWVLYGLAPTASPQMAGAASFATAAAARWLRPLLVPQAASY